MAWKITVPSTVTHADRSGEPAEPVWFFGGAGYVEPGDPRLRRYRRHDHYLVEEVPSIPAAYRQAIADLSDEDRGRIGTPIVDPATRGDYTREPYLAAAPDRAPVT